MPSAVRTLLRLFFLAILASSICAVRSIAQEVTIESNVAANPPDGGWHPWYETHVDPDNANHMLICGSKWNAKDNASYGFVYYSADGGKNWKQALEDKSSTWVTEQSCAYGVNGVAYFVSDASKVIDDELHHDLGTTRIFTSKDGGKTWTLGIETGWTDYSASVVDTKPGPNQNRLYVYFNNLNDFYNSLGQKDAVAAEKKLSAGTRLGMISYKDGDAKVAGPFSSDEMAKDNLHGNYPTPAIMMNDHTIVTIFTTKRVTEKNERESMVESVRTSADRKSLDAPVKMVDSLDNLNNNESVQCAGYFLGSAGTYDPVHDKLYYAYSDVRDKKCTLLIMSSADGGKTWEKSKPVYLPHSYGEQTFGSPTIAVNQEGLLAVMWEKQVRSGCWVFATLAEDGRSLSSPQQLGTCSSDEMKPSQLTSDYLWTSFFQADRKYPNSTARINLRNTRNSDWRNADAIAVTPDGEFHPVWIDAAQGEGEIRMAAVRVVPAATLVEEATKGMKEVTNQVAVLYGGDQGYDERTRTLTLDITIKNTGAQSLAGPFKLAVTSLYKRFGNADVANAANGATGAGSVWNIGGSVPAVTLAPGESTRPFPLKFTYYIAPDLQRSSDDILGLSAKVYATVDKDVAKQGAATRRSSTEQQVAQ